MHPGVHHRFCYLWRINVPLVAIRQMAAALFWADVWDVCVCIAQVKPESAVLAGAQGATVWRGGGGRLQVVSTVSRHSPVFQTQHPQLWAHLRQELLLSGWPWEHRGSTYDALIVLGGIAGILTILTHFSFVVWFVCLSVCRLSNSCPC